MGTTSYLPEAKGLDGSEPMSEDEEVRFVVLFWFLVFVLGGVMYGVRCVMRVGVHRRAPRGLMRLS